VLGDSELTEVSGAMISSAVITVANKGFGMFWRPRKALERWRNQPVAVRYCDLRSRDPVPMRSPAEPSGLTLLIDADSVQLSVGWSYRDRNRARSIQRRCDDGQVRDLEGSRRQVSFPLEGPERRITAASQGYETKANAEKGIEAIKTDAPGAKVEDHTNAKSS
jgi:uncharacterized protein